MSKFVRLTKDQLERQRAVTAALQKQGSKLEALIGAHRADLARWRRADESAALDPPSLDLDSSEVGSSVEVEASVSGEEAAIERFLH